LGQTGQQHKSRTNEWNQVIVINTKWRSVGLAYMGDIRWLPIDHRHAHLTIISIIIIILMVVNK
jgi:hypothetical protein